MVTITVDNIEKALLNTLGKKGMPPEEIKKLAEYVMNFFGYHDTVTDNLLRAKDRDVFYMLEEVGILTTFQDQVTIKKGKIWRIHYWVLKKNEILRLATLKEIKDDSDKYSIYQEISDDMWDKHSEEEELN